MSDCISAEKDLEKLKQFAHTFGINTNQAKDIIIKDIKAALKSSHNKCLLVLTEVQNKHVIRMFDFDTKVLITTRNKNVRDNFSKHTSTILTVEDSFTYPEGTDLLQRVLKEPEIENDHCTDKILEKTKLHPYILTTVAKDLEGKPKQVWREATIDTRTNNLMYMKIHNSLNVFSPMEREIFEHFVIFQHSVEIPLTVISKLCKKDMWVIERTLKKFEKFSVVQLSYNQHSIHVCSQRYIYLLYLKNNSTFNVNISEVHRRLVNIYE